MASTPAPDAATTALQAAGLLADVAWDEVDASDALATAVTLGRLKAVVDGALVAVAERVEATGAADAAGWASTKDLLTHLLGGRKGAGAAFVRVADRTADLPAVRAALAAGEVSLAQASVITGRIATLPRDPELREQAADLLLGRVAEHGYDATDLDRSFPAVVRDLDPDGTLLSAERDLEKTERGAHIARHLSFTNDTLGGVKIIGYGTVEDAELIKTTLMPLAAPTTTEPGACGGDPATFGQRDEQGRRIGHGCPAPGCNHSGKDPRDHGVRMWDALVEACTRLQATDTLPQAHGTTARITLTMSYDDLRQRLHAHARGAGTGIGSGAGAGLLPSGATLSATAVRRLACDAEIIPGVLGAEGQILDLGRATRLVTTALWLALVLRDQHCAFPGCIRLPIACEAHHIIHWADGGPTSLDNLVLLCRKHHTLTHRTPWTVHLDPVTRKPVWTPPPPVDDRAANFTYYPARPRPPLVA